MKITPFNLCDSSIVFLFGIPFHCLTTNEVLEQVFQFIEDHPKQKKASYIATVNIQFVFNTIGLSPSTIKNHELLHILRQADLITADGMPIIWLSKLLNTPLPERVTGADLFPKIAQRAAQTGKKIYLLGGLFGVAQEAATLLKKRYPKLQIVGISAPIVHTNGYLIIDSEEQDQEIVDEINRSGADILFLGFGNPKQEIWFQRNKQQLKVPVTLGVGGAFAFASGRVHRAPKWMQEYGFEWIYRLIQEPKRLWKRYFGDLFPLMLKTSILLGYQYLNKLIPASKRARSILFQENLNLNTTPPNNLLLDFSQKEWLNNFELAALFRWCQQNEAHSPNFLFSVNARRLVRWLKLNHGWDYLKNFQTTYYHQTPKQSRKLFRNSAIVDFKNEEAQCYLILKGHFETNSAYIIKEVLPQIFPRKPIILQLSACSYIDCSILRTLLQIQERWQKEQCSLLIQGASPKIRQIFKIFEVDIYFKFI